MSARRIALATPPVAVCVAVALRYGFGGVVVLVFFAFIAAAWVIGLMAGGDLIRRTSRARFERRER